MTHIEAMKQALEALEAEHSAIYGNSMTARAITSLRQAIATEESNQEPTGPITSRVGLDSEYIVNHCILLDKSFAC